MPFIDLPKHKTIYKVGQPLTALHLITSGSVRVFSPTGEYLIGKGDVIGVCEICSEVHFLGYETVEDVHIMNYPLPNPEALQDLFEKNPDFASLSVISVFRQMCTMLNHCEESALTCGNLYNRLQEHLSTYQAFCEQYHLSAKELTDMEQIITYVGMETPDMWLTGFYQGLLQIFTANPGAAVAREAAVVTGFLRKASLDFRKTYLSLEEQLHYQEQLLHYYINSDGEDLFSCYTSLFYQVAQASADTTDIYAAIQGVISTITSNAALDKPLLAMRLQSFREKLTKFDAKQPIDSDAPHAEIHTQLAGSLSEILEYASADIETASSFRQDVEAYRLLSDKSSSDEQACRLRRRLTDGFYTIYSLVLKKGLTDNSLPLSVKLFLYFGFVDEELAGEANSVYLCQLLDSPEGQSGEGVYAFFDWMRNIYEGKKQPSRNEFGEDYVDYLHKQKASGKLSDEELRDLSDNPLHKVEFELNNVFPTVNKITYGRVTTFCPVLAADNVLRELSTCHVTAAGIRSVLDKIRAIDYSVFYRETLNTDCPVAQKENIHVECLPDFILMPNAGIRGVTWQEIEGRKRTTPSRMMVSVFHMEDLYTTTIRLVGDYRWEMCKRVQGARWNDLSERSLTSEYFDYIQFYKKNNELSSEAKERIRQSLQGAKNSFKEMFIRDYLLWIQLESTASPRLNKIARQILYTYCPFSLEVRKTVQSNPLYGELLRRHEVQCQQHLNHLNKLCQKLRNEGTVVPETIEQEVEFYRSQILT
ncbi:MAG: hypothetical protein K2O34_13745 [Acetatifactor sp.]|nr:hypothetical protein [Acetatifactor sp.]